MTITTNRESAINFYHSLIEEFSARAPELNSWMSQLPPYLCKIGISEPKDLSNIKNIAQAYTGNQSCEFQYITTDYGMISLCDGNFLDKLFKSLPLSGYIVKKPSQEFFNCLEKAFELLKKIDEGFLTFIHNFTSLIVLLEKDPNHTNSNPLTSVSLPIFPFCTFMTETALLHIAPDIIFPNNSFYALLENLYHESAHQELSFKLLAEDIFIENFDPSTAAKVNIPWRKTQWEIDRVLHAAYVYWRLIPLRRSNKLKNLFSEVELSLITMAAERGESNFRYLTAKLQEVSNYFTDHGKTFLNQLC